MIDYKRYDIAFFDLDGTVLDEKGYLLKDAKDIIQSITYKKYIATGRSLESLKGIPEYKELIKYFEKEIICYNGNGIYDSENNSLEQLFSINAIDDLSDLLKLGLGYVCDIHGKLIANTSSSALKFSMYNSVKRSAIQINSGQTITQDTFFIHLYGKVELLCTAMKYFLSYYIIDEFMPRFLIIYPKDTDKARGAKMILEKQDKLKNPKIISFGNGPNDVGLFIYSDYAIAVNCNDSGLLSVADTNLCIK